MSLLYCCLSIGVLYQQLNEKPCDYTRLAALWEKRSQNTSRALIDLGNEIVQDIIITRKGTFIALNVVASVIILTAVATIRIFLSQLSVIETTQLADRLLRFLLLKVVFLGAVVNPAPADIAGYLLWACFTAFQKAFVGLAKDREEALLSSPTATIWQHMRCASLLGLMIAEDAAWITAGVHLAGETAPFSWAFLWFFDSACVGIEATHASIRYLICGFDRWRAQRGQCDENSACNNHNTSSSAAAASEADTESRSQFLYLLDLALDLVVHALNLVHYGHILRLRGGLRMQLIDIALLTDVRFLLATAWRRGKGHIQYRRLTHKLRYSFPNAPIEELTKEGGVTCAICMEDLRKSAKALPCGHIYHLGCLREWLQQGQGIRSFTCPVCRATIVDEEDEEESVDHTDNFNRGIHRQYHHHHEYYTSEDEQEIIGIPLPEEMTRPLDDLPLPPELQRRIINACDLPRTCCLPSVAATDEDEDDDFEDDDDNEDDDEYGIEPESDIEEDEDESETEDEDDFETEDEDDFEMYIPVPDEMIRPLDDLPLPPEIQTRIVNAWDLPHTRRLPPTAAASEDDEDDSDDDFDDDDDIE